MVRVPPRRTAQVAASGGGGGGGLPGLPRGGGDSSGANPVLNLIEREKLRADRTNAISMVSGLRRQVIDEMERPPDSEDGLPPGIKYLHGAALWDESEKRIEAMQGRFAEALKGLTNDRQREIAKPYIADLELSFYSRVQQHVGAEREKFHVAAHDEQLVTMEDELDVYTRNSVEDGAPVSLPEVLLKIDDMAMEDAEWAAANPEYVPEDTEQWMAERDRERRSRIHEKVVSSLLGKGLYQQAEEYLKGVEGKDGYKGVLERTGEVSAPVAARLQDGLDHATSIHRPLKVASEVFERNPPIAENGLFKTADALEAGLSEIRAAGLPEEEARRAEGNLRELYQKASKDHELQQDELMQSLAAEFERDRIRENIEGSTIFTDRLSAKHRADLRSYMADYGDAVLQKVREDDYVKLRTGLLSDDPKIVERVLNDNKPAAVGLRWQEQSGKESPEYTKYKELFDAAVKGRTDAVMGGLTNRQLIESVAENRKIKPTSDKWAAYVNRAENLLLTMDAGRSQTPGSPLSAAEKRKALMALTEGDFYMSDPVVPEDTDWLAATIESLGNSTINRLYNPQTGEPVVLGEGGRAVPTFAYTAREALSDENIAAHYTELREQHVTPPPYSGRIMTKTELRELRSLAEQYPDATVVELRRLYDRSVLGDEPLPPPGLLTTPVQRIYPPWLPDDVASEVAAERTRVRAAAAAERLRNLERNFPIGPGTRP